ncbi:hypothetical protein EDB19DRAFT_1721722 [Suillus lakei]|nr:hypothetical protein EDB19DRAFT_1721722 [Suillus lakei]
MSKTPTEKTNAKQRSDFLVLKHGQKRVMVNRDKSYKLMLDSAREHFPGIPRNAVTLQTNQLDICEHYYVDITAETWDKVIDLVTSVEVTAAETPLPIPLPPKRRGYDKVNVQLVLTSGEIVSVTTRRTTQIQRIVDYAARRLGNCSTHYRAILDGSRMDHNSKQLGGKPVIDLYSPTDADVSVKLSLSPEWSFSAIHGNLTENNTGLDVSYLFWEAKNHAHNFHMTLRKTNSDTFPRSPASKPESVDVFSPTSSTLDDTDSVVISVDKVTAYLDKLLKVFGLHTKPEHPLSQYHTKTGYCYGSYWLPSILKHEYIALRFVPQPAYERAVSLSISPQPDVVTHVFMLSRGICKDQLADWTKM